MDFIEKVLSGEIRLHSSNLTERLDILSHSLTQTFEQLVLAFHSRFPNISEEVIENHVDDYVQRTIITDIDHSQLNEMISFIGQLLIFLPQSEWGYFLSFITSQAATDSHHHSFIICGLV